MNSNTNADELLKLAKKKFVQLTKVEKNFFRAVVEGKLADCANSKQEKEVLKADRIIWLCTVPEVQKFLKSYGIQISGAIIFE